MHKGEELILSSVCIEQGYWNFEVKVDVQKETLRFRETFDNTC
jgi:hypothetical protein